VDFLSNGIDFIKLQTLESIDNLTLALMFKCHKPDSQNKLIGT